MRYEIDQNNTLRVYNATEDDGSAPFLLQPYWPDGTPWENKAQVIEWASIYIESITNPNSKYIFGLTPTEHPRIRPVEPEISGILSKEEAEKLSAEHTAIREAQAVEETSPTDTEA